MWSTALTKTWQLGSQVVPEQVYNTTYVYYHPFKQGYVSYKLNTKHIDSNMSIKKCQVTSIIKIAF